MELITEVPQALLDCGISSPEKFIQMSLEHLEFMGYESACTDDLELVSQYVIDLIAMVQQGNMDMGKAIKDVQEIIAVVPKALTDCGLSWNRMGPLRDNMTCEDSMVKIAKEVPILVNDI
jgi:hypothetical protein